MTAAELRRHLDTISLGPNAQYLRVFEVDAATYGRVCADVFRWCREHNENMINRPPYVDVALGVNGGIMFKNVELILREDAPEQDGPR